MPASNLTWKENLLLGTLGGSMEAALHMPIITLKICQQDRKPFPKTIPGWYRGLFINVTSIAPITAIQFLTNGIIENTITNITQKPLETKDKILSAASAGAISSLLSSPAELLIIQQQQRSLSLNKTISLIRTKYGNKHLMRGLGPCMTRESIYTAGYMAYSPIVEKQFFKMPLFENKPILAKISGCCISGIAASLITHPIDTAKTRIQSDIAGSKYKGLASTVMNIYHEGGIKTLYKGGIARTTRACGAFLIFNLVGEVYKNMKI